MEDPMLEELFREIAHDFGFVTFALTCSFVAAFLGVECLRYKNDPREDIFRVIAALCICAVPGGWMRWFGEKNLSFLELSAITTFTGVAIFIVMGLTIKHIDEKVSEAEGGKKCSRPLSLAVALVLLVVLIGGGAVRHIIEVPRSTVHK